MQNYFYESVFGLSFSACIIKKKDSESFSSGIDRAGKKLYQAKSEGRNKVIM